MSSNDTHNQLALRESPAGIALSKVWVAWQRIVRHVEARDIVRYGSLYLICTGVSTLCGWLFHWRTLLQFSPGAPFITCDTACGLILAGLGLLAASREARRLSRALGVLLLVLGGVYLMAALQPGWFTIHSFFPDMTAAVVFPMPIRHVKMAAATALVFALLGILLILLAQPRPGPLSLNVAVFLAGAVPSLGLLGVLTSAKGIANERTWMIFIADMAVPTAISACVAGVSVGALCAMRSSATGHVFQTTAASFTLVGLMLLFVGVSVVVVTNADLALQSRRDLNITSTQIALIRGIVDAVRRAETGQRGFLLTGRDAYLQDYELGLRSVKSDLETLRANPYGDRRADVLRTLIKQKLEELATTISRQRMHQRAEALAIVGSGKGFLLMAGIDAESANLGHRLQSQLAQRLKLNDETLRITQRAVVLSYGIAMVLISLGLGLLRAEIRRRAGVESELHKRTSEIKERTTQLETANKELEEFAFVASHDLKAPLRVIDNAAQWLEEDLQPHFTDETRESMNLLRQRVGRMDKLLDDLLEYARIGRKTDARYAEIVAGDALMDNVVGLLSIKGFSVRISRDFAAIRVPRMPLQQILLNLIGNAIKHHDQKKGCIDVTVEESGAHYTFTVSDDGPGIAPQFHDQIFKMFQTLRPRDRVEGSGMGLAMVRKHVEVFGGALQLESAEGQGSTFRLTWPKHQQPIGEAA
jgi:signal transduction histidine kinase